MDEPDVNEKLVKELADRLWDQIIHFHARQELVAETIRAAYKAGWHQGWKDAPSDDA